MVNDDELRFDTRVLHAGRFPRQGAAVLAEHRSTVWEQDKDAPYHDLLYPRLNNLPNQVDAAGRIAALEGGAAGLVTSSGMSAISTTLLALVRPGERILAQEGLYGGSYGLLARELTALGYGVDFIDATRPETWSASLFPETSALLVESLTNPLLRVADHHALVELARERELVSIIDSTFSSPVAFRPLALGYDVVVHSATKYLNGQSDVIAGAIVSTTETIARIKGHLDILGGCIDPHAASLLSRGLNTLALRYRHQSASATTVARTLETLPGVARVHYPALTSHPEHARAAELFDELGGVLSFELADATRAEDFCDRLKLFMHGPSLGGVESLASRPATMSHAGMPPAERQRLGISDALVRISIGLEDAQDLCDDLATALSP